MNVIFVSGGHNARVISINKKYQTWKLKEDLGVVKTTTVAETTTVVKTTTGCCQNNQLGGCQNNNHKRQVLKTVIKTVFTHAKTSNFPFH